MAFHRMSWHSSLKLVGCVLAVMLNVNCSSVVRKYVELRHKFELLAGVIKILAAIN